MDPTITLGQLALVVAILTSIAAVGTLFSIIASNKMSRRIERLDEKIGGCVGSRVDKVGELIDNMSESLHTRMTALVETIPPCANAFAPILQTASDAL